MTVKTSEEYVATGGVICPFCESSNIRGASLESSHGHVYQDCECDDCGKEWTDEYVLTGYSPVNS